MVYDRFGDYHKEDANSVKGESAMSVLNDCTYRGYEYLGCHPGEEGFVFRVWAPNAQAVSVVGDFNYWDASAAPMTRDFEGYWTAAVPSARRGQIYKYAVTGPDGRRILKADPFAFHAETGPATGSKVWTIDGYDWGDGAWMQDRTHEHLRGAHRLLAAQRGGDLPQL